MILFGSPETGYINTGSWHPCLPTVQNLRLTGFDFPEVRGLDDAAMCVGSLFDWFSTKPRLRRFEINAFDETVDLESKHNWNTILPLFKDTLEHLSFTGYEKPISEEQMMDRFGPSRMLTCLSEFDKLAYLEIPLHFVSTWRPDPLPESLDATSQVSDNDRRFTITHDNVRKKIEIEFPPSLKTADIIEYENYQAAVDYFDDGEIYTGDEIRVRETYRLSLNQDGPA